MYNNLEKYKSQLFFLIKIVIVIGASFVIIQKVKSDRFFSESILESDLFSTIFNKPIHFILIISLTVINWTIESLKWKNLVSSIENITFTNSVKQSLVSTTASLVTPNRIGEYGVKVSYYISSYRKKILGLNFLGNLSQMFATIIFGVLGLFFLYNKMTTFYFEINAILIFTTFLVLVCYFILRSNLKWIQKFKHFFTSISLDIHIKNIGFSLLKYLVFSHQFYFLLYLFQVDLDYFTLMSCIFSTYLIASIIPGFVAFDFLIKGSVALTIFGFFNIDSITILSITSIMWLLNFALPAAFGCFFIFSIKPQPSIKIPSQ